MKSSIGANTLQLLGGIIPFAIFHWGFGIAIWLSIALAVLVVGIFMMAWQGYLRTKDPV